MHQVLMTLATIVRRLRNWLIMVVLIGGLAALNVAMVVVPAVGELVSNIVWDAMSLAPEGKTHRPETTATLREGRSIAQRERDLAMRNLATERAAREGVQSQLEVAGQRLQRLEAQLSTRADEVLGLRQEVGEHRRSLLSLTGKLEQNTEELSEARLAARGVVDRMRRRALRMTARDTGSTFLEVIPGVGALVVGGTLLWDVADGCAQLSDLRELEGRLGGEPGEAAVCGMGQEELMAAVVGDQQAAACVEARTRLQVQDPPECEGLESALSGYHNLARPTATSDGQSIYD